MEEDVYKKHRRQMETPEPGALPSLLIVNLPSIVNRHDVSTSTWTTSLVVAEPVPCFYDNVDVESTP